MSTMVRIGGGGGYKNRKIYMQSIDLSETFIAPKSTYYHIIVVGRGGESYTGTYGTNQTSYASGGGGGVAVLKKYLNAGEEIPITVNSSLSSFGSYATAYKGESATSSTAGQGGSAVGGNINATGTNGVRVIRKIGDTSLQGATPGYPSIDTAISTSKYEMGVTSLYSSPNTIFNLGLGGGYKFDYYYGDGIYQLDLTYLFTTQGGVLVEWN